MTVTDYCLVQLKINYQKNICSDVDEFLQEGYKAYIGLCATDLI